MEHDHELEQLRKGICERQVQYVVRTGIQFNPDADHVDQIMTGPATRLRRQAGPEDASMAFLTAGSERNAT